ncbi:hypothetical protein PF002_g14895 [Phytophthora fragariae]|uniref:Uncharacterized protein n=1 Tax=Phytophthora fragariae TaxID=53985 RepID=A0A6A3YUI9_9STRA|nr:hypothetical protein PF002_g14895 [Phytophthora fragariae]
MATYDPTELDYWNGNQEAEACVQQAASVTTARDKESAPEHDYDDAKLEVEGCVQQATSVTTACDKESAPEYDYNNVKHEADACAQQAASVTTARDERSAPEPDCDDNNYNYENPEVEACAQQATSTMAARDEESTLAPGHDHYEGELETEVSAQPAASVSEARNAGSALEPETVAESYSLPSAAVSNTPYGTEAKSDGSVSAVRVLFQRPVCEPDPNRTVIYESFGCNTGWAPARAALAAQERAAQAEADEESLCETPAGAGRSLPSRWRTLVRRTVYQLVKEEDRLGADSCPSCSSPLSPPRNKREELMTDDRPETCDLPVQARSVVQRSVTTEVEQLIEKLVREVVDAYTTNATLIQSKVVERGPRCPRCRSLAKLPKRGAAAKRVSFDCSSLFSTRSEAFGSNGSRHDREDGVFEYVYVVTETERPGGRRPGLREVPEQPDPYDVDGDPFPDGKRIIGSVGGVEAVWAGR